MLGRIALRGMDFDDGTAGVAYWTLPAARGSGVATLALAALKSAFTAWNWTTRPETKPHAGSPQEPAIAWRAPSAAPLCTTTADTTCTCTPMYGAI